MSLSPLNVILDADAAGRAGWGMIDLADACLAGGARFLQVRAKHASSGWLVDIAGALVERAHRVGAVVIVNDRADVAVLARADGVHVGQDDLPPTLVRRVIGGQAVVGFSTHGVDQVERALDEQLSYVAIGPVFETSTKATGYRPLGLDGVRDAADRARTRGLPVVAIGGITLERAPGVLAAGASAVAVISDILAGGDPASRVRAYLERLVVRANV
jgi:thiamine-phosphate pyrophosphorylase